MGRGRDLRSSIMNLQYCYGVREIKIRLAAAVRVLSEAPLFSSDMPEALPK